MKPLAVLAAASLMLAACQGSTSAPPSPASPSVTTSSPSASVSATPSATPSALPMQTVLPETVLPENAQKYMLMLEDTAPQLTNNELFAVELGQGACTRKEFGWSEPDIRAWIQFVVGQHSFETPVLLDDDQANRVLAAAIGYLC